MEGLGRFPRPSLACTGTYCDIYFSHPFPATYPLLGRHRSHQAYSHFQWNNVPPTEYPDRAVDEDLVGSPWIRGLRGLRRMGRVALHVEVNLGEDQAGSAVDYTREQVRRVVYFVRAVRNSILREGDRLGNDLIHVFYPHARNLESTT